MYGMQHTLCFFAKDVASYCKPNWQNEWIRVLFFSQPDMIKCVKWKSEVLLSEKARCIHYRLTTQTGDCIYSPQEQNCLAGKWLTLAILDLAAWSWLKQPDLMQIQLNFNPALCIPPSHVQCILPSHAQIIPSILHTTTGLLRPHYCIWAQGLQLILLQNVQFIPVNSRIFPLIPMESFQLWIFLEFCNPTGCYKYLA